MENQTTAAATAVGGLTILSGLIAFTSYFLVLAGINFNFDFFSDPAILFRTEGASGELLRWSMITDVFGYYLLLLPFLFYAHAWLKTRTWWSRPISFSGLAYILLGSAGAAILAVIWPMHLAQFQAAGEGQQATIELLFTSFTAMVYGGLWNLLNAFLGGVWWLAVGWLLRPHRKVLGWFTMLVGVLSLLDWLGNTLGIPALAEAGLNGYLLLAPLWAIVTGISLLRKKEDFFSETNAS